MSGFKKQDPGCNCCASISCGDGSIIECFDGKCMSLTIDGWSDGSCSCCSGANGEYISEPIEVETPETCGVGGGPGIPDSSVYHCKVFGTSCCDGEPWPLIANACFNIYLPAEGGGTPYIQVIAHVQSAGGLLSIAYYYIEGDEVRGLVNTLCDGGAIEVPASPSMPLTHDFTLSSPTCGCANLGATEGAGICTNSMAIPAVLQLLTECPDYPAAPDCTAFDACTDMDALYASVSEFEDCTIADDSAGAALHPYLEERTYSNLNSVNVGTYTLDSSTNFDPGELLCITQDPKNFYVKLGDYESASFVDRYADPGELWNTETHAASFKDEYYAVTAAAEVSCADGLVTVDKWHYAIHIFRRLWNGSSYNTTPDSYTSPSCTSFDSPGIVLDAPAGECSTSGLSMISTFDYDKCGTTKQFTVLGTIGAAA